MRSDGLIDLMVLNEQEIDCLAKDIVNEKVFTEEDIADIQDLGRVFLPINLGLFATAGKYVLENIGLIYEYTDRMSSRQIDGYPIFKSMNILHKDNIPELIEKIRHYETMLFGPPDEKTTALGNINNIH